MSETPETDYYTKRLRGFCDDEYVPIEFARKLEIQRDKWKANHDNQVTINRLLRDRPDMGERAKLVDELIQQRDRLAEALRKAVQWADCASIHIENRHEINWTHLNEAKEALATVKGGEP